MFQQLRMKEYTVNFVNFSKLLLKILPEVAVFPLKFFGFGHRESKTRQLMEFTVQRRQDVIPLDQGVLGNSWTNFPLSRKPHQVVLEFREARPKTLNPGGCLLGFETNRPGLSGACRVIMCPFFLWIPRGVPERVQFRIP